MLWKNRLYDTYVSSGQASVTEHQSNVESPENVFRPRAAYIRGMIARHIPQNRSARIIDLGCGYGAFLYYLRTAGYNNISGVNVSPEQIQLAHNFGILDVKCRDLLSELSQTSSSSVDLVLLMDILEHLDNDELFEMLDQVFRVMKKGGTCVVHVPNAEGLYGMRIRYGDFTHERAFAPKSAEQLFRAIGFEQIKCFEDRPEINGVKSLCRRILWIAGTSLHRLLLTAETGTFGFILSQNMLVTMRK